MSVPATATFTVEFGCSGHPQRLRSSASAGRLLRVTRLLAFAHHIDTEIRAGAYVDLADASRQLGLTRARLTQVMNLLLLAPVVQESILAMFPTVDGRDPVTERTLRTLTAEPVWNRQIAIWDGSEVEPALK